jgi:thiol-disulfide isomerase/thioredoxin
MVVSAKEKQPKKAVTVSGKVQFLNPEKFSHFNKVWIVERKNFETRYMDSTTINSDGTWKYTFKAGVPKLYDLDIAKWDRKTVWTDADVFIQSRGQDTAKIKIKNPPYVFAEGSSDNNFINLIDHVVYRNYQNMIASGQEQYRAGLSKDTAWTGYLKRLDPYRQLNVDLMERIKVLIRAYKDKPVVLYGLKYLNYEREKDIIVPILDELALKNKWFTDGITYKKEIEEKIIQTNKLKPGKPMPVVAYNGPDGKPVSIDSFKGKYLLVDFWASWCGPCRQAIPKIIKLYEKYNSKGFEVFSISIDKDEKAWRKALLDEEMPWKQVLSPDMNATMKLFNFSGIPTLYFLDKEGKIVVSTAGFSPDFEEKIVKILDGLK